MDNGRPLTHATDSTQSHQPATSVLETGSGYDVDNNTAAATFTAGGPSGTERERTSQIDSSHNIIDSQSQRLSSHIIPGVEHTFFEEELAKMEHDSDKQVIILAVDATKPSEIAFDYYLKNVFRPGYYLHVVNHSDCWHSYQPHPEDGHNVNQCKDIMDKETLKIKAVEDKYKNLLQQNKIPGEYFTLHGKDAWHDIISHQEKSQALMIVMGTRGHGTLSRAFRGSVSDSVVHHATCPVLVCCHPKH